MRPQIIIERSMRMKFSDKPSFSRCPVISRSGSDDSQDVPMRNHLSPEDLQLVSPAFVIPRLKLFDCNEFSMPKCSVYRTMKSRTCFMDNFVLIKIFTIEIDHHFLFLQALLFAGLLFLSLKLAFHLQILKNHPKALHIENDT